MPDGALGQDDIDKLLAELGADTASPPAADAKPGRTSGTAPAIPSPGPLPSAQPASALTATTTKPQPVAATTAMTQDEIDALLAKATETVSKEAAKPPTASPAGRLDQGEIDKLLADLDPQTRQQAPGGAAAPGSGHMSQESIDRLLNELGVETGEGAKPAAPPEAGAAAPAPPAAAGAAPAASATAAAGAEGPLSQEAIDRMLAQLGPTEPGPAATAAAPPAATPSPAEATQALSPQQIQEIVTRQETAPPGHESEAVIAQADIDALVKQLAQATGAPEAGAVADALAGKAADIDRIQAEAAAPPPPEMTRDAVDVNSVLGRTASTASLSGAPAPLPNTVATVATVEWRAARTLLVAAVLLLALACGGLITLALSVGSLATELRSARETEHPAVDSYADRLALALAKLEETDEAERSRGVRWMEELKRQHPDRAAGTGIALARHFRAREAWRRAADEYGTALDAGGLAIDDPRIVLEYADCLARLGDVAGAIRQVYTLLAAESRWLAERDDENRPVAALDRNRQTVADAYLTLGRLLARQRDATAAARPADPVDPTVATATATVPAPGGGH